MIRLKTTILSVLSLALPLFASPLAWAQDQFPNRPVKLISPYSPGGITDAFGRGLADYLSKKWNQSVVVENKPGGAESVAASSLAAAAPNGLTLLIASDSALIVNGLIKKNLPYDPKTAFTPITRMAEGPGVLVVYPTFPARTLKEYLDIAKKSPGTVTYGTEAVGSSAEFRMRAFGDEYSFNQIPYNGSGPTLTAILGGQIDSAWMPPHLAKTHSDAKRVFPIAISGAQRSPLLPDVKTIKEQGYSTVDTSFKMMLVGPSGMAPAIVDKIAADVGAILKDPVFQQAYLKDYGYIVLADSPQDFSRYLDTARLKLAAIVAKAGIQEK